MNKGIGVGGKATAEAEHLKANSLKFKIFEFDMAISSLTYVLQFILIDFNDNHPH